MFQPTDHHLAIFTKTENQVHAVQIACTLRVF